MLIAVAVNEATDPRTKTGVGAAPAAAADVPPVTSKARARQAMELLRMLT
jgi:hypothetical protein